MNSQISSRLHASTGIIYALVGVLPLGFIPPPPEVGATQAFVVNYYAQHGTVFQIINFLGILCLAFFLWFLNYLRAILTQASPRPVQFPQLMFGAACIWATIFFIFSGIIHSFPLLQKEPSLHPTLRMFSDLTDVAFTVSFVPAGVTMLAVALAILTTNILPKWLGLLALPISLFQFIASFALIIPTGPFSAASFFYNFSFASFAFWFLLTSLYLIIKPTPLATY